MKNMFFKRVLALALTAALIIPAVPANAASRSAKAEKKLTAKAEKLAVADALSGSAIPIYYGLVDINGDKVTEMITAQGANTNTITIYGYSSKVIKLGKAKNVYDIRLDKAAKKIIVISGNEETGKGAFTEYVLNKKGTKLTQKDKYTYSAKKSANKKNGKKISADEMDKYVESVYDLDSVLVTDMSDLAAGYYDNNVYANGLTGALIGLGSDSFEARLYSVTNTDGKEELKEVKKATVTAGQDIADTAFGKFDLSDMGLLPGESFTSYAYSDDESSADYNYEYYQTTIPVDAAQSLLPGYALPENTDEIVGKYTVDDRCQLVRAEIFCSVAGAPVLFAVYTFDRIETAEL
ncbi:MAG: hypothetical protein IKQ56_07770 [Lachnospiraceae bacterium]|nr:hypothetical protein [Lachnospiraceae bacterium]